MIWDVNHLTYRPSEHLCKNNETTPDGYRIYQFPCVFKGSQATSIKHILNIKVPTRGEDYKACLGSRVFIFQFCEIKYWQTFQTQQINDLLAFND
jgi:hypothetical protein